MESKTKGSLKMDNIFTINSRPDDINQIEYYTVIGQHKFLDNDNNPRLDKESDKVFAKKIVSNNKSKFYIKVGTYGKIYNPIGLYSEGTENKFLSKIGKKAWEFKEVNNKIFDMYISFLRTKNIAWINNAEREMN